MNAKTYLGKLRETLSLVAPAHIESISADIAKAIENDHLILVAGNGGSAATAAHWVADLQKTITGYKKKGARAICLTDNIPVNTAWANDRNYEMALGEQAITLGRSGDTIIVISASGNSANVVNLVHIGLNAGMNVIAFLGFDGGKVWRLIKNHQGTNHRVLDCNARALIVPSAEYGVVEDMHSIFLHAIVEVLK